MDGQEKLLDYETIKAAVAELPAGTRITIKRAAPSYAALRLSPAHPRNRYTRCASVPVSGANNRQFQGFSRTFAEVGEYFILSPSIPGMAAVILPIVLRRSALWYIQIKFSSSTVKCIIPHTSNSFFLVLAAAFSGWWPVCCRQAACG